MKISIDLNPFEYLALLGALKCFVIDMQDEKSDVSEAAGAEMAKDFSVSAESLYKKFGAIVGFDINKDCDDAEAERIVKFFYNQKHFETNN